MARYKPVDTQPKFVAIDLAAQLLPVPSSMPCTTYSSRRSI